MNTSCIILGREGFTLIESVITIVISVLIITGLLGAFILCNWDWHQTSLDLSTTRQGNQCLERMVYGVGTNIGMRGAYWVTNWGTSANWRLQSSNYYGNVWYLYDATSKTVIFSNSQGSQVIGKYIASSQALATNGLGLSISLTLQQTDGRYTNNDTMNTYIKLRAPKQQ